MEELCKTRVGVGQVKQEDCIAGHREDAVVWKEPERGNLSIVGKSMFQISAGRIP